MELDQRPHQGEADAETAARTRERAILLREEVEDVGQELGADAGTAVRDLQDGLVASPSTASESEMVPPVGVNFEAFESRLTITCSSRASSPETCTGSAGELEREQLVPLLDDARARASTACRATASRSTGTGATGSFPA